MPTASKFSKGQAIRLVLKGFGETSYEDGVVLKVTPKGVWLDNGPGNDPSGPFDATTGRERAPSFGMTRSIEPATVATAETVFKKGEKVKVGLTGAGFTTYETKKVLNSDEKGVWLDNGRGNDPSGPFDAQSGNYLGAATPGFSMRMELAPKAAPKARAPKP